MNIELYIENKRCDTGSPESLGVTLKRQFLNPSEMNSKDAQKSYTISLPATDTNNRIFGMLNVEERKGKFIRVYDALLLVDGIPVLEGKFRLSAITADAYKGNLGVPAPKTPKDIFGDAFMNRVEKEWKLKMSNFVEDAERYNRQAGNPDAFFPLVLYGLLPKTPDKDGYYSQKDIIDGRVFVNKENVPPSINCLQAIRHIFGSKGYEIGGTAFDDERLAELYMSYHNPVEYEQPWGNLNRVYLEGEWKNYDAGKQAGRRIETSMVKSGEGGTGYAVNLLGANNLSIGKRVDKSGNIHEQGAYGRYINIPAKGYYKIRLRTNIAIDNETQLPSPPSKPNETNYFGNLLEIMKNPTVLDYSEGTMDGRTVIRPNGYITLANSHFEIKLLRDWEPYPIELEKARVDKVFYQNNLIQENDWNKPEAERELPKYFPEPGKLMFIDQKQNGSFLCGMGWGETDKKPENVFHNYIDNEGINAQAMAVNAGKSWSGDLESDQFIRSLAYCEGYKDHNGTQTSKHKTDITHAPETFCARDPQDALSGSGYVEQVVWLEAGEKLHLVAYAKSAVNGKKSGWVLHGIRFSLDVTPYKMNQDAIPFDDEGGLENAFDWNTPADYGEDSINLVHFLPSHVKINEWVENFCATFNLSLGQVAEKAFRLDIRQKEKQLSLLPAIDLDRKASARRRENSPLGLPAGYRLRFTVDEEEEGYFQNDGADGSGEYATGVPPEISTERVEMESKFSYNWFKKMRYDIDETRAVLELPVISKTEVWEKAVSDYDETMGKSFTDSTQRFWYRMPFNADAAPLEGGYVTVPYLPGGERVKLSLVSNSSTGGRRLTLDYSDTSGSVMRTYFTLMTGCENSYTTVECYLTPEEYNLLPHSTVSFNGDHYYVAEVDGYDPLMRKPAKLRLIRKIL